MIKQFLNFTQNCPLVLTVSSKSLDFQTITLLSAAPDTSRGQEGDRKASGKGATSVGEVVLDTQRTQFTRPVCPCSKWVTFSSPTSSACNTSKHTQKLLHTWDVTYKNKKQLFLEPNYNVPVMLYLLGIDTLLPGSQPTAEQQLRRAMVGFVMLLL